MSNIDIHGDIYTDSDPAERGLRCYVRRVAIAVGTEPEATWCELADTTTAYLALPDRLPTHPTRDAALLWDDRHGWALAVETHSSEDMLIVAYYGPDRVPPPEDIAAFTKTALAGYDTGQPHPPPSSRTTLDSQLANYIPVD